MRPSCTRVIQDNTPLSLLMRCYFHRSVCLFSFLPLFVLGSNLIIEIGLSFLARCDVRIIHGQDSRLVPNSAGGDQTFCSVPRYDCGWHRNFVPGNDCSKSFIFISLVCGNYIVYVIFKLGIFGIINLCFFIRNTCKVFLNGNSPL